MEQGQEATPGRRKTDDQGRVSLRRPSNGCGERCPSTFPTLSTSSTGGQQNRGRLVKHGLVIPLDDEELLHLYRILVDRDEAGALAFLDQHLRKKALQELEGG